MFARRDLGGDFGQMQVHCFGIAGGQNKGCALAVFRADCAKDICRGGALVARRRWARSTLGPSPCDLVLLADAGLIGEPDFYIGRIDAFVRGDFRHARWEIFF